MANKAKVVIPVEVDKRSVSKFYKDLQKIGANVGKMSMGSGMSTTAMMKNVRKMQEATKNLGGAVSKAVTDDVKKMGRVVDELEDNAKQISELESRIATKTASGVGTTGDQIKLGELKKNAKTLSTSLSNLNKSTTKSRSELKKRSDQEKKLQTLTKSKIKNLREEASFSAGGKGADTVKGITGGISKALTTKGAGALGGVAQAAGGAGKLVAGAASSMGIGGMDKVIGMVTKFGPAMSMAAGAITSFVQILLAASDHMTELNKTLVSGTAFLNDMTGDSADYSNAIKGLRQASIDSAGALLQYGKTSKDTAGVINAYTRATTGSLIRTQATLSSMDGGIKEFSERAVVYGAALNMESTAVAEMMGKFRSEAGYAAKDTQRLMNDIVFTVSNAGMPVEKFMNIFNKVIPDVDLFENRIENLIGTMKFLSKSMSPKDVERFMMAFKNMFRGRSFQQKLQTTLIVGAGTTSKMVQEDMINKLSANSKHGARMVELLKKGESGRKEFVKSLNDLKASGEMDATQYGETLKIFENYVLAASGDATKIASSLEGVSQGTAFELMGKEIGAFVGGKLVGIKEHVAEQRGYSQEQIQAMKQYYSTMNASLQSWHDDLRTGSKEADAVLLKMVSNDKKLGAGYAAAAKEGPEALRKFLKENVKEAMVKAALMNTEALVDPMDDAKLMAKEQAKATMSISDKLSNVIAFLLEKIYGVFQPILDVLNDVFEWISDSKEGSIQHENLMNFTKAMEGAETGTSESTASEAKIRGQELHAAVARGYDTESLAEIMEKQIDFKASKSGYVIEAADAMASMMSRGISAKAGGGIYGTGGMASNAEAMEEYRQAFKTYLESGDIQGAVAEAKKAGVSEDIVKGALQEYAEKMGNLQASARVKMAAKVAGSSTRPEELITDQETKLHRKLAARSKAFNTLGDTRYEAGQDVLASLPAAQAAAGAAPSAPSAASSAAAAQTTAANTATAAEAQTMTAAAASATQASTEALAETAQDNQRKVPAPIKTAWHKIITESVREGVEDPLVRHAMLLAKSQSDPAFAATMAAGIGGGGTYGFSGFKDMTTSMATMRGAGVTNEKMLESLKSGARTYHVTINGGSISDPEQFADMFNKAIEKKAQAGEPTG
jgi:hypothetical protein